MLRANAGKASAARVLQLTGELPKPKVEVTCRNCGVKWIESALRKHRFCSTICYRRYMAGRFDRWMASPQSISLPQSFDEFMGQEELPCLVAGCDWTGMHLGAHVNFAHGIPASEFKRAAGFNLKTGLVTEALSELISSRPHLQGGISPETRFAKGDAPLALVRGYRSLEGREHYAKSRALMFGVVEMPPKVCRQCGIEFIPTPLAWGTKFCGAPCRNAWYRLQAKARIYRLPCGECGCDFDGAKHQELRHRSGLGVFCSLHCKAINNTRDIGAKRRATAAAAAARRLAENPPESTAATERPQL